MSNWEKLQREASAAVREALKRDPLTIGTPAADPRRPDPAATEPKNALDMSPREHAQALRAMGLPSPSDMQIEGDQRRWERQQIAKTAGGGA